MGLFSKSKNKDLENPDKARRKMVSEQIVRRGITDKKVLDVMCKVPRHRFVSTDLAREAYNDTPLPIGRDQTISQPYIVASMTEQLQPDSSKSVLEIGTGSGYQTAVLAELFDTVVTVEYFEELSQAAQSVLKDLGYKNISFHVGDGLVVPADQSRYDAIIVTAAPAQFPKSLIERMNENSRMVIPVGVGAQNLLLVKKDESNQTTIETLFQVRFVPLLRS